jgi:hypothetical protein
MGLLEIVESPETKHLVVVVQCRASASQADGVPSRSKADTRIQTLSVCFWPKADTRGRILGPKIGYPAFFGLLSVR